MRKIKICLSGLGNVGHHFVKLLNERHDLLKNQYNLDLQLHAIAGSRGGVLSSSDITRKVVKSSSNRESWSIAFPGCGRDDLTGCQVIENCRADVLVEATPTNLLTGEPGLTNIRTALERGISVVTLTKGPLVKDFPGLMNLAKKKGVSLKFSGATAAALPTVDMVNYCLAGSTVKKISGILNGTTNYILTKMSQGDIDYHTALKEAQEMGVAESNPELDVEGWDTAAKILILTNTIYGTDLCLDDIPVTGIQGVTSEMIDEAARDGKTIKLIGESCLEGPFHNQKQKVTGISVSVSPVDLESDHALSRINGTTKAINFETDTLGDFTVVGGKSDPRAAAAAVIKDIVNLARENRWI